MPSPATFSNNHEKNRLRICLICKYRPKKKSFKTSGKVGNDLKILYPDLNVNDERLPAVVCDACRQKIARAVANTSLRNNIKLPDYKKYRFQNIKTRLSTSVYDCDCTLCDEVRAKCSNLNAANSKKKKRKC